MYLGPRLIISSKRVAGWLEFELEGFDRIVYEDTGMPIQYRHLYTSDKYDVGYFLGLMG